MVIRETTGKPQLDSIAPLRVEFGTIPPIGVGKFQLLEASIMRGSVAGVFFIFVILGGLWTLYWWVPGFKAVAMGTGRALSGPEILLIRLSDLVVIYDYAVFPMILAACVAIVCGAFRSDHESPKNET